MSAVLIPLVIIVLLVLFNGLFVAAEFAIVAARRSRMAQLAETGSRSARRILKILRDPDRQNQYIATAQLGITIVSLGLGMYGEHTVAEWLLTPLEGLGRLAEPAAHTIATLLSIALLTYLHVVIGEMIPKTLALQYAEDTALRLDRPMALTERLFLPAIVVLNAVGTIITRAVGIPPVDAQAQLFSPEELEFIVEESQESGLIGSTEQLFIQNIFDFSERTVGQVMTPRTRIVGIPVTADEETALHQVGETGVSRYPIYEENLDNIVGLLHIKDLARYEISQSDGWDLRELARSVIFVPETLSLEEMLIRFRRGHTHLAIVVDEFGGTAGLVTLEDLVEDVVGEIQDEFDREIPVMKRLESGRLQVRGDLILEELNQHYDLALEHPGAHNVSGLIMALLGRVPERGDTVTHDGVEFEVASVEGMAVQTAIVHLPGRRGEEGDGEG